MYKTIVKFAFVLLFFMPLLAGAQSAIDKVYEKYAGKDGFTSVNISKEMFQMFAQMNAGNDTSAQQMKKMVDQLTGMKVLTFNGDSTKPAKTIAVYNEFAASFPNGIYKELMTVNDDGENIRFLTRQEGSKIGEMVMLMKGRKEAVVLSITGNIDLATISKLSKGMGIHGLENIQKMKEHHK
jgi:hypothetical protein